MADSATFLESVGGDGSTVTGDANPTTGLANGGHRKRFVNALAQVVAVASNTVAKATEATASSVLAGDWAIKISGPVAGGEYSAKYHALAAEDSRGQTQGYAETIIAMTNIDFGGFSIVDGELLTTYVDLDNSVPSIVDGEFVITY